MALLPTLLAIAAGIAFGVARAGRFTSISRARVRHPEFLLVAIGCALFVDASATGPTAAIAVVGFVGALAFAFVNLHLTGMSIIALGIVLNLVPVMGNGAMPVRAGALVEAEMIDASQIEGVSLTGAREIETSDTRLAFLGDTIPVRWTNQVVSFGDILMFVGLADVVANLMLTRRRRRLPPSALPALEAMGWKEDEIDLTGDPIDLRIELDLRDTVDLTTHASADSASSTASPVHD